MAKKPSTKSVQTDAGKPAAVNRQQFHFTAPNALSVLLAGSFTQWQQQAIPMQKRPDGVWVVEVELPPGTHHYRFIVDGEWHNDPDCTLRVSNSCGGENMVRHIP